MFKTTTHSNDTKLCSINWKEYDNVYNSTNCSVLLQETIGKGAFGIVRAGKLVKLFKPHRFTETNIPRSSSQKPSSHIISECCAVKCFANNNTKVMDTLRTEVSVLKLCKGLDCVAKMLFVYESQKNSFLGLELCDGGDLYTLMSTIGLARRETTRYLMEIGVALSHIHQLGIIYHDLKPENICLDKNGHVKLIDFGLACILNESHTNSITGRQEVVSSDGSIEYSSPEIFARLPHAFEADWWSYGVVAYEMLCGSLPFKFSHTHLKYHELVCDQTVDFIRNELIPSNSIEEAFVSMFLTKSSVERFGYHKVNIWELLRHEMFE